MSDVVIWGQYSLFPFYKNFDGVKRCQLSSRQQDKRTCAKCRVSWTARSTFKLA
ncbi:unnamed protein product [Ixodes pacificus]